MVVRFRDVGMRYGAGPEVLHDITFDLEPGAFHFLAGPSGAGKTSLLKLMYLAHRPSRGIVQIFDRDVATVPRRELPNLRRRIGVIFQDFRLLNHLSALDNVALPLRIAGASRERIRDHVAELLDWVGLGEGVDVRPPRLSDGEKQRVAIARAVIGASKQRVAIARAVIGRPSLLLADEPTGNVDAEQGERLGRLFLELNKIGTTVVIATHDEGMIERFGRPVLRLEEGELRMESAPATV